MAAQPDGQVRFGVAGWSYPDWQGVVYPRNCKDTLRAVAQRVELIEINNTFYRPPNAKHCAGWVERTKDLGTLFTAKLPQEFTHQGVADPALIDTVRAGFAPLCASGRCRGLLAQFNYTFEHGPAALQQLALLARSFGQDAPLIVELRHRSWNAPAAMAAARALGISVAALDYPGMASGFGLDVPGVFGPFGIAYFRLHGRNPAWFHKGASRDQVYDWEYGDAEVRQIEARIGRLSAAAPLVLVVANNHFGGNAVKVVEQLLRWYRALGPSAR